MKPPHGSPVIRWSHSLHQVTGAMSRFSTSARPPPHETIVDWAETLLRMAKEMREHVEGERKEV